MSINIPLTIKVFTEPEAKDAPYIAYIPEFDISSCAQTEQKAIKNVKEALELMFEEMRSAHTLNEYLKEAGISTHQYSAFPKIIIEPFLLNF